MIILLTIKLKLLPTAEEAAILNNTMAEYISLVNDIVDYGIAQGRIPQMSTASINAPLPAALKNQCIRDARSIWQKTQKNRTRFPTLRQLVANWNNQNYTVEPDAIAFPVWLNGKSKKIHVKAIVPEEALDIIRSHKLGTMRISRKNGKFIAQIAYEEVCKEPIPGDKAMGVDLGILCPAVSVTDDGKTKFYGNGRQNKFVRRRYKQKRRKLGKAKKLSAIRKLGDKEQRWMKDQDHKISRDIVNEAVRLGVSTIKLEKLSGIRSTARTSRKNNPSLHTWSFYRLSRLIEYKAAMAGIKVKYVDPKYTSQTCPVCGNRHKTKARTFRCPKCGYRTHRDCVGAVNICHAA